MSRPASISGPWQPQPSCLFSWDLTRYQGTEVSTIVMAFISHLDFYQLLGTAPTDSTTVAFKVGR